MAPSGRKSKTRSRQPKRPPIQANRDGLLSKAQQERLVRLQILDHTYRQVPSTLQEKLEPHLRSWVGLEPVGSPPALSSEDFVKGLRAFNIGCGLVRNGNKYSVDRAIKSSRPPSVKERDAALRKTDTTHAAPVQIRHLAKVADLKGIARVASASHKKTTASTQPASS